MTLVRETSHKRRKRRRRKTKDVHWVVATTQGKERVLGGPAPYGLSLTRAMSSPTAAANTYYLSCPSGRADELNHELRSQSSMYASTDNEPGGLVATAMALGSSRDTVAIVNTLLVSSTCTCTNVYVY